MWSAANARRYPVLVRAVFFALRKKIMLRLNVFVVKKL
jgi:hypothetical protein